MEQVLDLVAQVEEPRIAVQSFTSELFPDLPSTLTTEFVSRSHGTTITTTHEGPSMACRQGYLRLGALERMSESSDHYGRLLSQLKPR